VVTLEHVVGTAESELPKNKVIYLILEGHSKSKKVKLSSEHDEYVWIKRSELPTIDLCEQFREFAQHYSKIKRDYKWLGNKKLK
jgi:hypothetical protein